MDVIISCKQPADAALFAARVLASTRIPLPEGPRHELYRLIAVVKTFFLLCGVVAGIFGAATVSRRILYVQAAPAALALILLWLA